MTNPLVLTFDMGTQSARAMLVDPSGQIVKKVKMCYETPYFSRKTDWAEQRPQFYWEAVCEVSLSLKKEAGELWENIIAVTCTCIRDTCVCLDKNGKPIRDIILWLDKRECANMKPLTKSQKLIFGAIGMRESVELQRKISNCNWIMENEPDIWKNTDKFVLLSAYFTNCFTGRIVDSAANLIAHLPIDSKTRGWMKANDIKRCIFDVEPDKLCEIVEPGTNIGPITAQASKETGIREGLPYIATGSDKGCETLGLSCTDGESAALSFGTTATVQVTTNYYMEPLPFIPAYPAVMEGYFNPEVEIFRGYWLISWFKREFAAKEVEEARLRGIAPEELLNERLREIPPGCDGLTMQPYFTPGVVMPKARGAIIGFSDVHSRQHIYRAIIEGINFALIDGLKTIEKRGHIKVKRLFAAGGGSQSNEICQITANMFGLPLCRIQTYEVSGLGSSMIAFVSLGIFADMEEAITSMVHIRDEFMPDRSEHMVYEKIYNEIFSKIFKKLLPLYKKQ